MSGRIQICRYCNRPEYWEKMTYLNGKCMCRECYKAEYEATYHKPYQWDDLDGPRPTMQDFINQEDN